MLFCRETRQGKKITPPNQIGCPMLKKCCFLFHPNVLIFFHTWAPCCFLKPLSWSFALSDLHIYEKKFWVWVFHKKFPGHGQTTCSHPLRQGESNNFNIGIRSILFYLTLINFNSYPWLISMVFYLTMNNFNSLIFLTLINIHTSG